MRTSKASSYLVGIMALASAYAIPLYQQEVHEAVAKVKAEQGGRVTFSILYNRFEGSDEHREYLAHLYEAFFAIPGFLGSEVRTRGRAPSVEELAAHFELSREAMMLLLEVMESDSRMPPILHLEKGGGEIESIDLEAVDEFTGHRGGKVQLKAWKGRSLPRFSLPTLEGREMSHRDLWGKAALIVIWLTGCPDCRRTLPNVAKLYERYGGEDFQVIGFNVDKALGLDRTDADREEFSKSLGLNFPSLLLNEETRSRFGNLNIFPTLIFVSAEGRVDRLLFNVDEYEVLEKAAAKVLSRE